MKDSYNENSDIKGKPYGYIYRITNDINGKVYIGKVECERFGEEDPLEGRFGEHVNIAEKLQKKRDNNPSEKFYGTHLNNAINYYGVEKFNIEMIDNAQSLEELNSKEKHHIKEHDSMDPNKGYNMREGGEGGRLHPDTIEKLREISLDKWQDEKYREKVLESLKDAMSDPTYHKNMSEAITNKWQDEKYREKQEKERQERIQNKPEWSNTMSEVIKDKWQDEKYRGKQIKERQERALKNPEFKDIMSERNQDRAKDPNWREKMTRINQERAKDPNWRDKMSEVISEKWQDKEYREKMDKYHEQMKKHINLKETLNDIKAGATKSEILKKQDIGKTAFSKRIEEHFGYQDIHNFTELKESLKNKSVEDAIRELEEHSKEKELKQSEHPDAKLPDASRNTDIKGDVPEKSSEKLHPKENLVPDQPSLEGSKDLQQDREQEQELKQEETPKIVEPTPIVDDFQWLEDELTPEASQEKQPIVSDEVIQDEKGIREQLDIPNDDKKKQPTNSEKNQDTKTKDGNKKDNTLKSGHYARHDNSNHAKRAPYCVPYERLEVEDRPTAINDFDFDGISAQCDDSLDTSLFEDSDDSKESDLGGLGNFSGSEGSSSEFFD
ncbi:MAG: hypothetical protein JW891_16130 [Candidatus Lokiarchaeota archaeon]|nr:hypothetical protein [Candidatus Lokiarchaeota archaeon]